MDIIRRQILKTVPVRRPWLQRRKSSLSRPGNREPRASTKRAPFASAMTKPGPVSPLLLIAGGD